MSADPLNAWQLLESFGYDLWLENVRYPSIDSLKDRQLKIDLLELVRKFVEIELCKEKADLKPFKPFKIRLTSNHMLEEGSLNETDDKHFNILFPDLFKQLNIKQI